MKLILSFFFYFTLEFSKEVELSNMPNYQVLYDGKKMPESGTLYIEDPQLR